MKVIICVIFLTMIMFCLSQVHENDDRPQKPRMEKPEMEKMEFQNERKGEDEERGRENHLENKGNRHQEGNMIGQQQNMREEIFEEKKKHHRRHPIIFFFGYVILVGIIVIAIYFLIKFINKKWLKKQPAQSEASKDLTPQTSLIQDSRVILDPTPNSLPLAQAPQHDIAQSFNNYNFIKKRKQNSEIIDINSSDCGVYPQLGSSI